MIELRQIPEISAVYYALLQSGYDFYAVGKRLELVKQLEAFRGETESSFWKAARQNSCKTYPYWPRAALLEQAALCIVDGELKPEYHSMVMDADNLMDEERDEVFWKWIVDFPSKLSAVMERERFREYIVWEHAWMKAQEKGSEGMLRRLSELLSKCKRVYDLSFDRISVVLSPIKCAYSADYHWINDCLFCTVGALNSRSILHECMHEAVHREVQDLKEEILSKGMMRSDFDPSYCLNGDEQGRINAFEECAVREIVERVLDGEIPDTWMVLTNLL